MLCCWNARCASRFRQRSPSVMFPIGTTSFICHVTNATLAYLLVNLCVYSAYADTPPAIDVIRAAYTQSVSSIQTLDCQYRIAVRILDRAKAEKDMLTWYEIRDIHDGLKISVRFDAGIQPGKLTNRFGGGFDGKNYLAWTASHQENADYFLPAGSVTNKRPTYLKMPFLFHRFLGFEVCGGFDLADLIGRSDCRVASTDTIHGLPCVVVDIGEHPMSDKLSKAIRTKVWFDPAVGFLPRQLRSESVPDSRLLVENIVTEFEQVFDPLTKGHLYLPKKAVTRGTFSEFAFEATSMVLNLPVAESLFRPDFPQGASVNESIAGATPKTKFVGGKEARKELVEKSRKLTGNQSNKQPATTAPSASPVSASESNWFVGLRIVGFAGMFLIAIFCAWRFRHPA